MGEATMSNWLSSGRPTAWLMNRLGAGQRRRRGAPPPPSLRAIQAENPVRSKVPLTERKILRRRTFESLVAQLLAPKLAGFIAQGFGDEFTGVWDFVVG